MAESKKVRCVANIPQPRCKRAENGVICDRRTAQGISNLARNWQKLRRATFDSPLSALSSRLASESVNACQTESVRLNETAPHRLEAGCASRKPSYRPGLHSPRVLR